MKLLLDTHTFLWFVAASPELSKSAKELLEDENNELLMSYASVWEMAIKVSLGKLAVSAPFETFISEQIRVNNIELLQLSLTHIATVVTLPFHHRDPFDRLLVAQAMSENLPLVSRDMTLDAYGIQRLW